MPLKPRFIITVPMRLRGDNTQCSPSIYSAPRSPPDSKLGDMLHLFDFDCLKERLEEFVS
jgi:hypothetical protein